MPVPSGSWPISTRASISPSSSVSGVSGAWRKERPAKITRPSRSPSRRRAKSPSTWRATSSRLPGLKSVAFMLLEMSSASMRFRALLRTSRTSCGTWGRASARIRSASAADPERHREAAASAPARLAGSASRKPSAGEADPLRGGSRRRRTRRTASAAGHGEQQRGARDQRTASSSSFAGRGAVPAIEQIAGAAGIARRPRPGPDAERRTSPGRRRPSTSCTRRRRPPSARRGGSDHSSSRRGALRGGNPLRRLQVVAQRVGHRLVVARHLAARGPPLRLDRLQARERRGVRIGRRRGRLPAARRLRRGRGGAASRRASQPRDAGSSRRAEQRPERRRGSAECRARGCRAAAGCRREAPR